MRVVEYDPKDEEKRQSIVKEQEAEGWTLVEYRNITEGNFLVFMEPGWEPPWKPGSTFEQITNLEQRTKLLEYAAQTTGETLDVHEGAIVDVMKLALGGSPEEL